MRTAIRSSMVIIATAAMSLALTGCGGDSKEGGSDATTPAVTDQAAATTDASTDASTDDTSTGDTPTGDADSGDGADTGSASAGGVCDLLDKEAISKISGVDFSAATVEDDNTGTCSWDTMSGGGLSMVSVTRDESGDMSYALTRGVVEGMFDDITDVSVKGADHAFSYMGGIAVGLDLNGTYAQVLFMTLDSSITDETIPIKLAEEVARNW